MTSPRAIAALTVALSVAVTAVPAPAAASHGCRSSTSKGAKVVLSSPSAVVFSKVRRNKAYFNSAEPIYYGCLHKVGTVHRMSGFTDFGQFFDLWTLAGRYVAFRHDEEEAAGSTTDETVYLYDLRAGKHMQVPGPITDYPQEYDTSTYVHGIVLKRNGSLAWIASFHRRVGGDDIETVYEVHKIEDELDRRRTKVDEGTNVDPGSLALSTGRRTLYWSRAGSPRSSPLR